MTKKVLITGAGGFIGGFIVEEALRRGYDVWAAVRATTSRKYLQDERIRFVELDFSDEEKFRATIAAELQAHGKWDYVVHNLGATKCANFSDFNRINYGYIRLFADTLTALDAVPDGFVMMSSMSVLGLGDEKGYTPFTSKSVPMANTRYGLSKLKAETYLQSLAGFPYIAMRPTGVYGPRERDYFLMIESIRKGFDFSVGYRRQMLTFIYVKDLASAVFAALESGVRRKSYLLTDGKTYSQSEFRTIVKQLLKKRFVVPVKAPLWLVKVVCAVAERIAAAKGKASTLNRDKYIILRQRNWTCDISDAVNDFGYSPRYDLRAGLEEAIQWYRDNGWL